MIKMDSLHEDLINSLVPIIFNLTAELNQISSKNGLSLTQLRVLGILMDRKLSMTELAQYLGLSKSTMTGLIDRAIEKQLLSRSNNETDHRAFIVGLTPQGLALIQNLRLQIQEAFKPYIEKLNEKEQRMLKELLLKILGY